MTRNEFINGVDTWSELIEFCREVECGYCDDIISSDSLQSYISDDFYDYRNDYPWTDIRSWLNDIEVGYDYYLRNGSFEYEYLTDGDFESYKDDVLSWMDRNGLWDEEDDDFEFEDIYDEDLDEEGVCDEEPLEEDISVSDLFAVCSGMLQTIKDVEADEAKAEEENFARFVCCK